MIGQRELYKKKLLQKKNENSQAFFTRENPLKENKITKKNSV